jgi:hypothetical protein
LHLCQVLSETGPATTFNALGGLDCGVKRPLQG